MLNRRVPMTKQLQGSTLFAISLTLLLSGIVRSQDRAGLDSPAADP
jgi:hypothetical protein